MTRNTNPPTGRAGIEHTARIHQRIEVPFTYDVHFTRNVFHPSNELLAETLTGGSSARRARALVYVDEGVAAAHPTLTNRIAEYFHARGDRLELAAPPQTVPGGEDAKNSWDTVRDILWTAGNVHLDRQSTIVAVGGGSVLDMVGFAASVIHRGVRLVRVPTTTLAQNDAGIGVKNGMNEHGQKNFVGTFAPPHAVLNDREFLATLTQRDWLGGVAEAFKVAIIRDRAFFELLQNSAAALVRRDLEVMAEVVRRCAELHLEHIRTSGDPFEFGSARPLDFGHWAGHKLEVLSGYRLGHGQAVSVGIALDSFYAARRGLLDETELEAIVSALDACELPTWTPLLESVDEVGRLTVLAGLDDFREHLGGALTITLPRGIGEKIEVHEMDPSVIGEGVDWLRTRHQRRGGE